MTGRWVDAAEALRIGLVNRVDAEPGQLAAVLAEGLAGRGRGHRGPGQADRVGGRPAGPAARRARRQPGRLVPAVLTGR